MPIYIIITAYNCYRAVLAFQKHDIRSFLLLWCSVSTFVFVRFYLVIFFLLTVFTHDVNDKSTYETLYTACLPYASMWGVIIPAVCLGADPCWLCLYGASAVLGPVMVALHEASVVLEHEFVQHQSGRVIAILHVPLMFLKASTDPLEYHDKKASPVVQHVV